MSAPDQRSATRGPGEPRFAGPAPWVPAEPPPLYSPPTPSSTPPPIWSSEAEAPLGYVSPTLSVPAQATPSAPVVSYGPRPDPDLIPPDRAFPPTWASPTLAVAGGTLAGIGSLLTWATLRLATDSTDSSLGSDGVSTITYYGLSLLEGRVMLVLGGIAIAFGVLGLLGRLRPAMRGRALAVVGALGLLLVVFAAIGHPVELSTLFRSYQQFGDVTVSLPNGVGVWLAMVGAALTLVSGLLGGVRGLREPSQPTVLSEAGKPHDGHAHR